jgi:7-cyano-7-deazaguanine synthase
MKRAIILLSGGLDSATTAAMAKNQGYELLALSFDYNQRHRFELKAAKKIVKCLDIEQHKLIKIDNTIFQGSALTDKTNKIAVPKNRKLDSHSIPVTYVPARNILFLSYATSYAESMAVNEILIGANAIDYSGYPDCRPEFIASFNDMIRLGTKIGIEQNITIRAPLIHMTKKAIITMGLSLGFDYELTLSCYDPDLSGRSCGSCDACKIRLKAFAELGERDKITYVSSS